MQKSVSFAICFKEVEHFCCLLSVTSLANSNEITLRVKVLWEIIILTSGVARCMMGFIWIQGRFRQLRIYDLVMCNLFTRSSCLHRFWEIVHKQWLFWYWSTNKYYSFTGTWNVNSKYSPFGTNCFSPHTTKHVRGCRQI